MAESWKFCSEEGQTISLHDHCITKTEEVGADLVLYFTDDGFDVEKENPCNPTGRHRNTGPAALVLKNWRFLDGAFYRNCYELWPDGTKRELPEVPLTKEMFLGGGMSIEVLAHDWKPETGVLSLDADGGLYCDEPDIPDGPEGFMTLELYAERLLFCWNDLPEDAWFQERGET